MTKIVFIGAGSIIFVKNLIGDCLLTDCLCNSEIALVDIDEHKLQLSYRMLENLNKNINNGRAKIEMFMDRRKALVNADFVINAIQVGGYEPVKKDFEIPMKYGLYQTYADTLGFGGIFRGLRTIPVVLEITKDMEEICPNAWLLNYTNPMSIVVGAILKSTKIKCVGLCHSVQKCAESLIEDLGMNVQNLTYKIAGINHQAWLLQIKDNNKDIYPIIREKAAQIRNSDDLVRLEILNKFGYFVTESSQHTAEYTPYFIKRNYPELIEKYGIKTEMFRDWKNDQIRYWNEVILKMVKDKDLTHIRTLEYASYIMESMITDKPYTIGGNVLNTGLITNLPKNCVVEVPCLVDSKGITPCYVGDLPLQCAALNRTNINVAELTIEAALTRKREHIYHAALIDPHSSAELSMDDIVKICDELILANQEYLPLLG